MIEMVLRIDSELLNRLKKRLGQANPIVVVRLAFSLLDWASREVELGRIILSSNSRGDKVHRLRMRELEAIRPRAK